MLECRQNFVFFLGCLFLILRHCAGDDIFDHAERIVRQALDQVGFPVGAFPEELEPLVDLVLRIVAVVGLLLHHCRLCVSIFKRILYIFIQLSL